MKPERPALPADAAFARQLASLSAQLREEGTPPARDLWPDIDRALDRSLAAGSAAAYASNRRRDLGRWCTAALAATVLVLVGMGVAGRWPASGAAARAPLAVQPALPVPTATPVPGPVATRQGLRVVEQALADLQTALERSPNDPDLSRLVLMIHQSRGRLLRLRADDGARTAVRGRS